MVDSKTPEERFLAIGIDAKTIANIIKNKAVTTKFVDMLVNNNITECEKKKGDMLYACATKLKANHADYTRYFVACVMSGDWNRVNQADEGLKWLDLQLREHGKGYELDNAKFREVSGAGVVVTTEQIEAAVARLFEANKEAITE